MSNIYLPIDIQSLQSEDVLSLAKLLLGKFIVSKIDDALCVLKIVETEAYRGADDKASHAYPNKMTPRTKTMFLSGGVSYIYLCYGIHNMFNVVVGPTGIANAILIRAAEPVDGVLEMKERRQSKEVNVANGPGKLCQALGITRDHNNMNICTPSSLIYLAENKKISNEDIEIGPRVGIAYAEECAMWPWRFRIKDNKYTSKPKNPSY